MQHTGGAALRLRRDRSRAGIGRWGLYLAAALALLPVLALGWQAAQGSSGLWTHLAQHVLPRATLNTLYLLLGVGTLAAAIGIGSAWLVSAYRFPGRGVLGWMLLLPLAVPTYIVAFAYIDMLHPLGPLQGGLRWLLGYDSPRQWRLPDMRSLWLAIVLMALVLYPYVYLTCRALFATQSAGLIEAGRMLGLGQRAVFWRLVLPLARPALAVGVALVLLESLNDIGASEFLGVQTLTVAIHATWVTRGDLPGAAQIALTLLALVLLLLGVERYGRRRQRFASSSRKYRPIEGKPLRGARAWLVCLLCSLPVVFGFVLPALHLGWQAALRFADGVRPSQALLDAAVNTLKVGLLATFVIVLLGLLLAWALRLVQAGRTSAAAQLAFRLASLGYALPGTVLAIGLMVVLGASDAVLDRAFLMGSMSALVMAYTLRFLAISAGTLDAGFSRLPPSIDQAAASLGCTAGQRLWRIHLPLLRPALAASALLVLVDSMKELPATLMLRPLNFETLATWLYAEAARGTYEDGALAGLMIVAAGLIPVIWLAKNGLENPEQ
ncbi:iron ABC transporter permease [Lysobacteraceae bacterium NML120232]|nr:iron ABC transporter permease [Xanthomonadaceae bacterium NML08-0793]PJK12580.1 iron ABC transporter permease [Xanthomonadaceae bacterium NML120232]